MTEDLPGAQISGALPAFAAGTLPDNSFTKEEPYFSHSFTTRNPSFAFMKIHRFAIVAALLNSASFAQTNASSPLTVHEPGIVNPYVLLKSDATGNPYGFLQYDQSEGNFMRLYDGSAFSMVWRAGNVGIGTSSPSYKLDVNGDAHIAGAFRIGELYFSASQTIFLPIGTERWVKLATIPNNHYVRFQLKSGSQNSEEIAEIKVLGTYHNDRTMISVERQTYNEHLREVRVVGANGYDRQVYIKIRATDYAPHINWRVIDSKGSVTIHNIEETPTDGLAHIVSGNLVTSTNANVVTTGNVGIGTTNPETKLTVTTPTGTGVKSVTGGAGGWGGEFYNQDGGGNRYALLGGPVHSAIFMNGNVGIGTTNPVHKLAVNGTIKAKEVIVETTGWSDYVFADGYALQPLSQVEAYIKEHKHLPGIPSASTVASNGVNVGDMQAALLAKVEELTLHLIAQEKELVRLRETEKDVAALRAEIRQLHQNK